MIRKLHLKNFGRFKDRSFDFKPVTVFCGNNESGKTTIFDALLDVICKPKGTTTYGRKLNERYTDNRTVLPEFDGEIPAMNEADFINLFAIRSGSITLTMEKDSQWMNKVKASLFSGGIDPKAVSEEIAGSLKSSAKGTLNREASTISSELEKYTKGKEEAENLKRTCIEEEKRIERMEKNRIQNAEEISALEKAKDELEKCLEQQRLIQKEKSINALFADITQIRNLKDELEKYDRFTNIILSELNEKEDEIQKLRIEAEKTAALEEENLRLLKDNTSVKAGCEAEYLREESNKNLAEHLRSTLVPREKLIRQKTSWKIRIPLIIVSGLLFIAGILSFFIAPNGWPFLAGAFAAALILAVFSVARQTGEDASLLEEAVNQACERWKKETAEDPGTRYEDVLAAFSRASERSRAAKEKYEQTVARINSLEQERQNRILQKQKAVNALEDAQRNFRKQLDETGSANKDEYSGKLAKKKNLTERYNELVEKLKIAMADYKAATITELEGILNSRIQELREKITETELPAVEIKAKENRLREANAKLDVLRNKDKENIGSVNLDRGTVRGRFKGLSEKIADYEKIILEKNIRLAEIKKEIKALNIARELFDSLSDDSALMFEQLSNEISEQFSAMTTDGRKINMNSFSTSTAQISDAGNLNQNEASLSAGTRDAFILAARLVLARKSRDNAIIVMDEPFLALDKQRTLRALQVLKEFHLNTNWQIIILTKDEETENQASGVFDDIKVNKL